MEISRMIFAACPPIYHLPGTWDDPEKIAKCMETLIPQYNWMHIDATILNSLQIRSPPYITRVVDK